MNENCEKKFYDWHILGTGRLEKSEIKKKKSCLWAYEVLFDYVYIRMCLW